MLGFAPVARLVGALEHPVVPGYAVTVVILRLLRAALVVLGEDGDAGAANIDVQILRALAGHVEVRMVGLQRVLDHLVR